MQDSELEAIIVAAFANRELLAKPEVKAAVEEAIARLDSGKLRVATPEEPGRWRTHPWVKQAILLYFAVRPMQKMAAPPSILDKFPLKTISRFGQVSRGASGTVPTALIESARRDDAT